MRMLVAVALAAACTAACQRTSHQQAREDAPPNILLVTIDTLRADRIGAGIAPALDRLAASSTYFTAARSAAPLTLPSHATIMTGLLPPSHGVRENGSAGLSPRHTTIAQLLHGRYRTAAFVAAYVLDRRFGLDQGFDTYDDRIPRDPGATDRLEAERPASVVVDSALAWLRNSRGQSSPWFVWIHLYDPHAPYNPPHEFVRATRDHPSPAGPAAKPAIEDLYNGEVAYADSQIARVFAWLRDEGLFDRTFIIVAGDHGEGLGEHGERTHGMLLYDSTLRVPLIVHAPGRAASQRTDSVSLVGIKSTIMVAAGASLVDAGPNELLYGAIAKRAPGEPLRKTAAGMDPTEAYAETEYPRVAGWSPLHALLDGRWKAIRAGRETELYDLDNDPHEERSLTSAQPATAAAMAARMDAIRSNITWPQREAAISDEARERLRALGYVAGSTTSLPSGAPNPAPHIAAWNDFESALAALNAKQPDAVARIAGLARENPDAPIFQTTYARALKDQGRPLDALEVYRRSARRWPTDPLLLHDLAVAARESAARSPAGAAAALQREAEDAERAALALSPATPMAHNGLGLLAVDQGRAADAAREFEQAAQADPNNSSYWSNLGNVKRMLQDASAAERAYRTALDIDPARADAANGLGVLLVEARRAPAAVPWFERALAASPDFVEARLNLGIALQEAGDRRRAVDAFRAVLTAGGNHPREKDAARKLLTALEASR